MNSEGSKPEGAERGATRKDKLTTQVLKPGDSFGNFRVVKCLCAGLIANYYHMQHVRDLRDVTVGIFHHRVLKDDAFLKRLEGLQKKLKNFDHEGIPALNECTTIEKKICIFLEPIKGQALSRYFAEHGTPGEVGLSEEQTTAVLARLLGILGYAHAHGIDHRDLDSDMVYIQDDGAIMILGLGIKKVLGIDLFEEIVSASVSPLDKKKARGRLSSFDVMSPEYKAGEVEDLRVDLHCVGVIGYWLLTARKPQRGHLTLPTEMVPGIESRWDDVLMRLLERKADLRFQSCKLALLALKETDHEPESEQVGLIQRQIDRIPVPKGIHDLGRTAVRVYRLTLIGIVGLTFTALAAYFLYVSFIEEEIYTKDVAQIVATGETPQLAINILPPVAKIEFIGFEESFIVSDGFIGLRVIPGQYEIRASAPNHEEIIQTVKVAVEEIITEQNIDFDLVAEWTGMQIKSEPGATVSVVDARGLKIPLGSTDETGEFSLRKGLFAGTYQILVKKEGYAPNLLKDQTLATGEVSVIEAPLIPLPASLVVRTTPDGALVTINDIEIGRSPVLVEDIKPSDKYTVIARLDAYRMAAQRIKIGPGQDVVVDLGKLVPKSAELQLAIRFKGRGESEWEQLLEDVSINLGGRDYAYGSPELMRVPAGDYAAKFQHPQYEAEPVQISLADYDVKKVTVELTPRPGEIALVLPQGLKPVVRLNGKLVQANDERILIPAFEKIEFELSLKNYFTMTRVFELEPNEKVRWEVSPVPIPGPEKGRDWAMPYVGIELAWIPAGAFTLGSPMKEQGRLPNEGESTEVTFTRGFWAGAYEVTQAEFIRIMGQSAFSFAGAKRPADTITWTQASEFCRKLTDFEREGGRLPEGYVYRLPTEAEWAYAARAVTTTPFHFGEEADTSNGNFRGVYPRSFERSQGATETYGTEAVGSYAPNAFGLYDTHGNVSEWTSDAYNSRLPGGRLVDPRPRRGGNRYALCGGSWEDSAVRVRTAARSDARIDIESNAIGFRVFLAAEE